MNSRTGYRFVVSWSSLLQFLFVFVALHQSLEVRAADAISPAKVTAVGLWQGAIEYNGGTLDEKVQLEISLSRENVLQAKLFVPAWGDTKWPLRVESDSA